MVGVMLMLCGSGRERESIIKCSGLKSDYKLKERRQKGAQVKFYVNRFTTAIAIEAIDRSNQ